MRKFSILLALLLVFSLAGCGGKDSAKADIFDLVEENSDTIWRPVPNWMWKHWNSLKVSRVSM